MIYNVVYSPFSAMVGLPPHNIPFPGVLMMSIEGKNFNLVPFMSLTTCVLLC